MRECKECEHCYGFNYDDGTPKCSVKGGFECCPYNDEADVKHRGIDISIDTGFMSEYIRSTLQNTIQAEAKEIACKEIKSIITDDIRQTIKAQMQESIKKCVDEEVNVFMRKEIVIGGKWYDDERRVTHKQYIGELIEEELNKRFKPDEIRRLAENAARSVIDNFCRKTKDSINANIKQMFTEATRQTLTDSVVNMLMCNDTYKKLSESAGKFLQ